MRGLYVTVSRPRCWGVQSQLSRAVSRGLEMLEESGDIACRLYWVWAATAQAVCKVVKEIGRDPEQERAAVALMYVKHHTKKLSL